MAPTRRSRRRGLLEGDRDAWIDREDMRVLTPDPGTHLHPLDPCDSDGLTQDRCLGIAEQMKILAEQRSDQDF
jgi:hypothetical protein